MTEQHTRRVMKFLASTHWNTEAVLKCQLAAMVLALRGRNVERAFWTQEQVADVLTKMSFPGGDATSHGYFPLDNELKDRRALVQL